MSQIIFKSHDLIPFEIERVASLHKNGIKMGFLSSLGEVFLRLLYWAISQSSSGVLIVAIKDGEIIGFVSGTWSLRSIYYLFIKRSFFVMPFALLLKMINPKNLKKIIDVIVYSLRPIDEKYTNPSAELLSIVVDEKYRGQGIAQALFEQLAVKFHKRGFSKFKIIVGEVLISAQHFYEKMGAQKRRKIEIHKGEVSWEYILDVSNK